MMLVMSAFLATSGCSVHRLLDIGEKPVYVPEGTLAEIAEPVDVICFVRNAETGKMEKRKVEAWPGWYVVRPRVDDNFGVEEPTVEPASTKPDLLAEGE